MRLIVQCREQTNAEPALVYALSKKSLRLGASARLSTVNIILVFYQCLHQC